ncbi:hypothetical protein M6B38_293050 [Iris pallida]|uniref:Uncharacterized protein n=1 Tax=Iris pallida TaxID=29817 RepID=A0AAX6HTZ9_IRIPA|nr:hypothetical protein M6B38_156895 [Iris pallida]KAJ6844530.1 hypothetical protein M6B38_293050 [Iris pallida]
MNFKTDFSGDDRTGLWAPAKCKRTGPTGRCGISWILMMDRV